MYNVFVQPFEVKWFFLFAESSASAKLKISYIGFPDDTRLGHHTKMLNSDKSAKPILGLGERENARNAQHGKVFAGAMLPISGAWDGTSYLPLAYYLGKEAQVRVLICISLSAD